MAEIHSVEMEVYHTNSQEYDDASLYCKDKDYEILLIKYMSKAFKTYMLVNLIQVFIIYHQL